MDIKNRKNYQPLLKNAETLFMKFGVKKVSVEEICKEANVSKMTFYRIFKNKKALVFELLNNLLVDGLNDYNTIMKREIPFPEKVKQVVLLKHKSVENISQEFIKDVYQSDDLELQQLINNYHETSTKKMFNDFSEAQKHGWIRKDIKPESIFYFLKIIQEKAFDSNYIALHNNMHDAIMEMTNFFFYGIINQEENS